jgi:hypothetical protein
MHPGAVMFFYHYVMWPHRRSSSARRFCRVWLFRPTMKVEIYQNPIISWVFAEHCVKTW